MDYETLRHVIERRYPKVIGSSILVIIGFIALIFGIHSDIYSSYDKFNSKFAKYNWFNPYHVVKFPVDQYRLNCTDSIPIQSEEIPFSGIKENTPSKAIYILDKTPSTYPTILSESSRNILKTFLTKYLNDNGCKNAISLDKLSNEDLLLMTMIHRLSLRDNLTNLTILFYWGDNSIQAMENYDVIPKQDKLCDFYKDYLKIALGKTANPNCQTNFNTIFEQLTKPIIWGNNKANHCLFLLSDFEHNTASGVNFSKLDKTIQDFSINNPVSQISLIKVQNRSNSEFEVSNTLRTFRENFNHIHYYEIDNNHLNYESQIVQRINHITAQTVECNKSAIFLYYVFSQKGDGYDFQGTISPNLEGSGFPISISLRDRVAFDKTTPQEYLLLNEKIKIIPFNIYCPDSSDTKTMRLKFTTRNIQNENYYLEVNSIGSSYKIKIPIILRQVLPVTSSILLFIVYSILTILTFYFSLFMLLQFKKVELHQWVELLLVVGFLSICCLCLFLLFKTSCDFYQTSFCKQDGFWAFHLIISLCCISFCSLTLKRSLT